MNKYKVKKGDSWIKIANNHGINVEHLFKWNGINPYENVPTIFPDQEIYISNPFKLNPSVVTADAPDNYVDYGQQGREMINRYALAVKQGQMKFDEVPKEYQTAVNQKMINNQQDAVAEPIAEIGFNLPAFFANPVGFLLGLTSQKGAAYAVDKLSGRNEYGIGDVFSYTPVTGRKYASEHPVVATITDAATGAFGGRIVRNILNPAWRQAFLKNLKHMGLGTVQRSTAGLPQATDDYVPKQGYKYQTGNKGYGKTGTVRGNPSIGYKGNTSAKATSSHAASGNGNGQKIFVATEKLPPMLPSAEYAMPPLLWRSPDEPTVVVERPKRHIYEQRSLNNFQLPNPDPEGKTVPFDPSADSITIIGEAPIGNTVDEQPFLNEYFRVIEGALPRKAVYVKGGIQGTPSRIHSGLGFTYGSENPGEWIVK